MAQDHDSGEHYLAVDRRVLELIAALWAEEEPDRLSIGHRPAPPPGRPPRPR